MRGVPGRHAFWRAEHGSRHGGPAARRLGLAQLPAPGRSRILLRPSDLGRSRRFYRDVLGLAVYREFGPQEDPGVVFFLGQALLEVSGHAAGPPGRSVMIWIQVRDVRAEHARLAAAGVPVIREPATEPWGLIEMWIEDPDGIRIVLVEVPADHPLRRDPRSASPPR
jgi:catechol 2,3-dioxygenase-like lactoylglutathione lyase family enzyme